MKKYALFLGCTTPTKVPQYELAARWVCSYFGIDLVDVDEFVCCGMNQVNLSIEAGLLMAAMNLAFAEARGLDILALCAACTGALAEAIERLGDGGVRDEVNRKLDSVGLQYKGNVRVKHISRALYEDIGLERIGGEVKRDLSDLVVAPHYGCHYLKPRSALAGFEEPDNPKTLHGLIAATGARPIDYETLGLCCGGKAFPVTSELPRLLIQKKLSDLKTRQVDAMVLQCQTCYLMYGDEQREIRDERGEEYDLPVLLYPQLLGLALGADPMEDLGLSLHSISADRVLAKVRER